MFTHATDAGWISRSHRAISPFRLVRPITPEEAIDAYASEENATFIAGGIDLVRRMRGGDVWGTLIDISSIEEMRAIKDKDDHIEIGALTTHWDIETSDVLSARLPDFQAAWTTIGNVRIRMAGTVGGNVLAREAGYDGPVILGVLGAELVFATPGGTVSVAADDTTAFPGDGLLTTVKIPVVDGRKMRFDRSLKPVVSAAVSVEGDSFSVGIGCAFPAPVFQSGSGAVDADAVSNALPEPVDNPMGGAAYRQRMAGVLAARLYQNLANGS